MTQSKREPFGAKDMRKYNGRPKVYLPGFKRNGILLIKRVRDGVRPRGLFRCHCGKEFETTISSVATGHATTCGCWKITHGKTGTRTYRTWVSMLYRCFNKNAKEWKYYGGRGITVIGRWKNFSGFLKDMGDRPENKTLDRIDPNGNYEPSNCRWATDIEQASNKRPRILPDFIGSCRNCHHKQSWHVHAEGECKFKSNCKCKRFVVYPNPRKMLPTEPERGRE